MSQPPHPLVRLIKKGDYITRFERWIQQHPDDEIREITGKHNRKEYNVLKLSIIYNRKRICEYLVTHIWNVNEVIGIELDNTILHWAVNRDKDEIVDMLLRNGADPNIQNINECNALSIIKPYNRNTMKNVLNIINHLISYKVNINVRNKNWETILHVAVYEDLVDIVKILLDNNVNKDMVDIFGNKAFSYRNLIYSPKTITHLIDNDIQIIHNNEENMNYLLAYILSCGHISAIERLLNSKYFTIDIHNKTINGKNFEYFSKINMSLCLSNQRVYLTGKLISTTFTNIETKSLSLEQLCYATCIALEKDMKDVPKYIQEQGNTWLLNYDCHHLTTPEIIQTAQLYLNLSLRYDESHEDY